MAPKRQAGRSPVAPAASAPATPAVDPNVQTPPVQDPGQGQIPGAPPVTGIPADPTAPPIDPGMQNVAPAGVSQEQWNAVRQTLSSLLGAELPEDYTPEHLKHEIYSGYDARNQLSAKDKELAAIRAKYTQTQGAHPGEGSPPTPAAPAQPGAANTPANLGLPTLPTWNPQWDYLPVDENGQIIADTPETARQIRMFHKQTAQAVPQLLSKLSNIDKLIEEQTAAAVTRATKFTEERLTAAQTADQFSAFMLNTPGLIVSGPSGPAAYGAPGQEQYRATPLGDHILAMVEHLQSKGMSVYEAQQFAMRFGMPPKTATQQPSMFLRSNQPVAPAAPAAPAAPPARRPPHMPANARQSDAGKYKGKTAREIMNEKAAELGLI